MNKDYDRWGVTPPTVSPHGTDEEIRGNMQKLMPHTWHLEGNMLHGQTEFGPLVQRIPTEYILVGTDDKGLPILEKIDFDKKRSKVVS